MTIATKLKCQNLEWYIILLANLLAFSCVLMPFIHKIILFQDILNQRRELVLCTLRSSAPSQDIMNFCMETIHSTLNIVLIPA